MFVHHGCTNPGLGPFRADVPEGRLSATESPALSPVRICGGFVIADYIRLLFAQCQVPQLSRLDR